MRRALLVVALLVGMGACSSGDDESGSNAATTTQAGTDPAPTTTAAAASLALSSTAFADGEAIPAVHGGCPPGENMSPPLEWSGVPGDADQLAITLTDPDAGGFVHWAVAGIDATTTTLAAGEAPAGSVAALNDTGQAGYFGPCPPETHTYVFTIHALSGDPGLTASTAGAEAVAAIEAASTAAAELSGTYTP